MARVTNLIIIILEIIAFSKSLKERDIKKSFVYYTQLSNLITLIASILLVVMGGKPFAMVLRYISVCMLVMTFLVTACILVPMSRNPRGLLFSGSGLFHHLIIPPFSTWSYMFLEKRVSIYWAVIPILFTLAYGLLMLYLNYIKKIEGPYPFFMIRSMGTKLTTIWMACLMVVISLKLM